MDAQVILFQMNALPNFTGKDVKCIYWELGECKEAEADLQGCFLFLCPLWLFYG